MTTYIVRSYCKHHHSPSQNIGVLAAVYIQYHRYYIYDGFFNTMCNLINVTSLIQSRDIMFNSRVIYISAG